MNYKKMYKCAYLLFKFTGLIITIVLNKKKTKKKVSKLTKSIIEKFGGKGRVIFKRLRSHKWVEEVVEFLYAYR